MLRAVLALAGWAIAVPASAHSGHAENFFSAFAHPFVGWDHWLAMLLVGVLAVRASASNQRPALLLPLSFVAGCALGLLLPTVGASAAAPAWLEPLLSASVVLLGIALACARAVPLPAGAIGCLAIGMLQGWAHGAELQGPAGAIAAGLLMATLALHAFGYGAARLVTVRHAVALRLCGLASALIGGIALVTRIA